MDTRAFRVVMIPAWEREEKEEEVRGGDGEGGREGGRGGRKKGGRENTFK